MSGRRGRWAVGALIVATLAGCGAPARPSGGGGAGPSGRSASAPDHPSTLRPGDCARWYQAQAGTQIMPRVVRCTTPHLAEVTAVVSTGGPGGAWPGVAAVAADANRACAGPTAAYLGHPLDPLGGFAASAVYPTEADWSVGDRALVCDLVARAPAGTATLSAVTGRVADAPVRPVFAAGTCLAAQATTATAVPCSATHEVEVTGDATAAAGSTLPTGSAGWQALVGGACATDAQRYLGAALSLGVASGWLPLPAASWAAGRRLVPCLVGRQMDDGGWEPTTGSLRSAG